jgi:hypothetical protein
MWLVPTPARSNPVIVAYVRGDGSGPPRNGSNPARTSGGKKNVLGVPRFSPYHGLASEATLRGCRPCPYADTPLRPFTPVTLRRYADIPDSDGYHHL